MADLTCCGQGVAHVLYGCVNMVNECMVVSLSKTTLDHPLTMRCGLCKYPSGFNIVIFDNNSMHMYIPIIKRQINAKPEWWSDHILRRLYSIHNLHGSMQIPHVGCVFPLGHRSYSWRYFFSQKQRLMVVYFSSYTWEMTKHWWRKTLFSKAIMITIISWLFDFLLRTDNISLKNWLFSWIISTDTMHAVYNYMYVQ